MTAEHESILSKIRKLFAKADSAKELGSVEEAAAFAAKANQLLLKYKLDMADVQFAAADAEEQKLDTEMYKTAPGARGTINWRAQLLNNIALHNFCRILLASGHQEGACHVIGRDVDRKIVLYLFDVLAAAAERQVRAYMASPMSIDLDFDRVDEAVARRSFLEGFAVTIGRRMREMRQATEQTGGQHALTIFNGADRAVDQFSKQRFPHQKTGKARRSDINGHAYNAGKEAGGNVSIHGGLGGKSADRGTLGRGQNLLGT